MSSGSRTAGVDPFVPPSRPSRERTRAPAAGCSSGRAGGRGALSGAVDAIVAHHGRGTIDKVVGIEARGFIVAAPVAYHFGAGFVALRKPGKLPRATYAADYALEYGEATLEVHKDALSAGDRVLIVDDVLATGGTAAAAAGLVQQADAVVAGVSVLLELSFLGGRDRLTGLDVHALIDY